MDVLHVVASLRGGAATHALELARRLPDEGLTCALAAPRDNPALGGLTEARFLECAGRLELARLVVREAPRILHCHGHRAAMWGRLLPRARLRDKRAMRLVVTFHGFHVPHYRSAAARWLGRTWERWAMRRTDLAIFVSEEDRRTASAWLKSAPSKEWGCVVYNGIDVERYCRGAAAPLPRRELGLADGQFVVGFVGRLHRQKSPGTLLEAAALLRADCPELRLLLIGDGPLEASLREQARRLGLEELVRFLPPRADLERVYPCMDGLALPSLWEGLPMVLLEAGAAGIPVIASDAPGNREVVAHGETGLLFPAGDAGALAAALALCRAEPEAARRRALRLAESVAERFTVQTMTREIARLYREAL